MWLYFCPFKKFYVSVYMRIYKKTSSRLFHHPGNALLLLCFVCWIMLELSETAIAPALPRVWRLYFSVRLWRAPRDPGAGWRAEHLLLPLTVVNPQQTPRCNKGTLHGFENRLPLTGPWVPRLRSTSCQSCRATVKLSCYFFTASCRFSQVSELSEAV